MWRGGGGLVMGSGDQSITDTAVKHVDSDYVNTGQ